MFQPAEHWKEDIEYIEAQYIVDNLQVTNDSAERGVKLSNDFFQNQQSFLTNDFYVCFHIPKPRVKSKLFNSFYHKSSSLELLFCYNLILRF